MAINAFWRKNVGYPPCLDQLATDYPHSGRNHLPQSVHHRIATRPQQLGDAREISNALLSSTTGRTCHSIAPFNRLVAISNSAKPLAAPEISSKVSIFPLLETDIYAFPTQSRDCQRSEFWFRFPVGNRCEAYLIGCCLTVDKGFVQWRRRHFVRVRCGRFDEIAQNIVMLDLK